MDTTLIVSITGETYQQLDLFEDIPITLTIQQSDLNDLSARRVPYSKTIQLPDTDNNARIFEHYFEVNGVDFNPLLKLPCVIQYRGTDLFQGILRLNSVSVNSTSRLYEIYILGEVSDFTATIKELELQDLSWVDLSHELTYSAITNSWQAEPNTTKGIFDGQVLYPMINYGLDYQNIETPSAATPSFTYSFDEPRSFDKSAFSVPIKIFKPAIRVKTILDKIFARTDYRIVSDFFDTDYFNSIYIDTFQNSKVGIEDASATTNQNIFKAQMDQKLIRYQGNRLVPMPFFDNLPGGYDPLNNWSNPEQAFQVPYQGDYAFNLRFDWKKVDPTFINGSIQIVVFKSNDLDDITNGTQIFTGPVLPLAIVFGAPDQNYFFSATCAPGEWIKAYIVEGAAPTYLPSIVSNRGFYGLVPYSDSGIRDRFILFDLYAGPSINQTENLVNFAIGVPNINCLEFLKSLVLMFNLVIIQDETTKQLRIEPYNWLFDDSSRQAKDFTNILDQDTYHKIEPLSFDLAKEVKWNYRYTENEYLNKLFFDRFDYSYGRMKFTADSDILAGDQDYTLPFAALPTSGITNGPNFIIPQAFYLNNGLQTSYATLPHIFFWVGNRYAYKDAEKTIPGYWYLTSGNTPVIQTTYPCVSHLSLLDSTLPELVSDLSFSSTYDFFGNSNTQIAQFTPFDLYSTFWQSYITNIYSPEGRRFSGNFFLRPIDIYETRITDKIFIKDANYSIEKIDDANLTDKVLTKVSLIKDVVPYYKITPPSPVYVLTGNTPYPAVEPVFTTLCYVDFDKTSVCNETAPLVNVITFGSGTLQNFRKVYFDTGSTYQLFTAGTYIKEISTGILYVVVDTYGRILEQTC